ncbi:hypothetical protein [Pseudarthrobacter sp. efr-133-R2A-89]|uniref:hypothetical protein n=1 Tax=Pseudarthrobacter sp. efr-133-R2A-89 TaxID=3040302 RepID=UPI0025539B87|nr:hypothetical protein [Pseudarthrobacter sp. efr-133-R2A-89]
MDKRWIFDGHISGIGTASGLRAVVGIWQDSPFGSFADVMVQQPSGHRLLLAPRPDVAEFIAATYTFDEVRLVEVSAVLGDRTVRVDAGPLAIRAVTGARTFLGSALRAVPRRLAVDPRWLSAVSPLAALAAPGARTYGTAGSGRTEYYGVTDLHHVTSAVVSWEGSDAGTLAPIRPAVTFGFSSVPPRPSVARVRTTVVQS